MSSRHNSNNNHENNRNEFKPNSFLRIWHSPTWSFKLTKLKPKFVALAVFTLLGVSIGFLFQNCQQSSLIASDTPSEWVSPLKLIPNDFELTANPSSPKLNSGVILKPSFYQNSSTTAEFQNTDWSAFQYKWTIDGNPIAGQTGITLTILSLRKEDIGKYQLYISKDNETRPSGIFSLVTDEAVYTLPESIQVSMSPAKQLFGGTLTLSVKKDRTSRVWSYFHYQWFKGDLDHAISGVSNDSNFVISNFQDSNKGKYLLRMSLPNDSSQYILNDNFELTNFDPSQELPNAVVLEATPTTPSLEGRVVLNATFPQDSEYLTQALAEQYYDFEWLCPPSRKTECDANKTAQLPLENLQPTDNRFQLRLKIKNSTRLILSQELVLISVGVVTVTKPANGIIVDVDSGGATTGGSRIRCGGSYNQCSTALADSSGINLDVVADTNYEFTGWTSGCTGLQRPCTAKTTVTVEAGFAPSNKTLTVAVADASNNVVTPKIGSSSITGNVGNINCINLSNTTGSPSTAAATNPICSAIVAAGTSVTLTANPASGYIFEGWQGCPGGSAINTNPPNICSFTLPAQAVALQANFASVESSDKVICARTTTTSSANSLAPLATGFDCYDGGASATLTLTNNSSYNKPELVFKKNYNGSLTINKPEDLEVKIYLQMTGSDILFFERNAGGAILNFKKGGDIRFPGSNGTIDLTKIKLKIQDHPQEFTLADVFTKQNSSPANLVAYNFSRSTAILTTGNDLVGGHFDLQNLTSTRLAGGLGDDVYVMPFNWPTSKSLTFTIVDQEGANVVHFLRTSAPFVLCGYSRDDINRKSLRVTLNNIQFDVSDAQLFKYRLDNSYADLTFTQLQDSSHLNFECMDMSLPEYTVTITPPNYGRITGPGIDCSAGSTTSNKCSAQVAQGSSLTLNASGNEHYQFNQWTGCASSTNDRLSCTVKVTGALTIAALFEDTLLSNNPDCSETAERRFETYMAFSTWFNFNKPFCISDKAQGQIFRYYLDTTSNVPNYIWVKSDFKGSISYDASIADKSYFYIQKDYSTVRYIEKHFEAGKSDLKSVKFTFVDGSAITIANLPVLTVDKNIFIQLKGSNGAIVPRKTVSEWLAFLTTTVNVDYTSGASNLSHSQWISSNSSGGSDHFDYFNNGATSAIFNTGFFRKAFTLGYDSFLIQGTAGDDQYLVPFDESSNTQFRTYIIDNNGSNSVGDRIRFLYRPSTSINSAASLSYECVSYKKSDNTVQEDLKIINTIADTNVNPFAPNTRWDGKASYTIFNANHFNFIYDGSTTNQNQAPINFASFKSKNNLSTCATKCDEGKKKSTNGACVDVAVLTCSTNKKIWDAFNETWLCLP